METLKICCDASQRTIDGRIFTCSGAICLNTKSSKYEILADSTNNRGELWAVYLACRLALEERDKEPYRYSRINIYSDSQFVIYGLTRWMRGWIHSMQFTPDGMMVNSSNQPVANQNMFLMIITFLWLNKLRVNFYNQKGHVNTTSRSSLNDANKQFYTANGYYLKPNELIELSDYNNLVDRTTRSLLGRVDPNQYPIIYHSPENVQMCRYIVPEDYEVYIRQGSER